jgi:hypothetical protein
MAAGAGATPWPVRVVKGITLVAVVVGAAALAFSVWALLDTSESLGGLWLMFWAVVFVPLFIVLGAIHLWLASRRGVARTEA